MRCKWGIFALLLASMVAGSTKLDAQSPESAVGDNEALSVGGSVSAVRLQYGQHWLYGAGAFANANFNWRYGIEGEANWSRWHQQSQTYATTYLVGPRYQLNAFGNYRFRPYAKFLIGDGEFNFPYNYARGNYFVVAPGAGIDYWMSPRLRLRLCDVEYQYWPGFTFGSTTNLSVTVGLRYRIR